MDPFPFCPASSRWLPRAGERFFQPFVAPEHFVVNDVGPDGTIVPNQSDNRPFETPSCANCPSREAGPRQMATAIRKSRDLGALVENAGVVHIKMMGRSIGEASHYVDALALQSGLVIIDGFSMHPLPTDKLSPRTDHLILS